MKIASLIAMLTILTTTIFAATDPTSSEKNQEARDNSGNSRDQAENDKPTDRELDRIRMECDLRADLDRAF